MSLFDQLTRGLPRLNYDRAWSALSEELKAQGVPPPLLPEVDKHIKKMIKKMADHGGLAGSITIIDYSKELGRLRVGVYPDDENPALLRGVVAVRLKGKGQVLSKLVDTDPRRA